MSLEATAVRTPARAPALTVRAFRREDDGAWDAFVARCPNATFFHRIGWREILEEVFRHRTHYLSPSAAALSSACCRSPK